MDSSTPPLLATRPLEAVIRALEAAIATEYGLRKGFDTALAGRCFLACATLSRWAAENGGSADLVFGQLLAGDPDGYAVHITRHAWLVLGDWLFDPTIVQAERPLQFGRALANLGPVLCVPVPPGQDARRDECRFIEPAGKLQLLYQPERRPAQLVRYRSVPDLQPTRSRRLIRAINATLDTADGG